jgi:sugar phosphate isomerase/epimerase
MSSDVSRPAERGDLRLCFSTLVCPQWTLEQIIAAAVNSGVGGIDFRGIGGEIDITRLVEFRDGDGLEVTVNSLQRSHLAMPCLNTSVTLVTPAAERWQQMLDECQRHAKLATRTGTRFLRVFGGKVPKEMTRDEGRTLAQRHLRQLVKVCHGTGTSLLLETHDDWTTSEQVLELIHEFPSDEVGVLWDIEHPFRRGESPSDTATSLRRYIQHVHVKDSVRGESRNEPRLLGDGDLPVAQCVHVLREHGYAGWYSLETEKRWHADAPDPDESIPQFVSYMRALEKP